MRKERFQDNQTSFARPEKMSSLGTIRGIPHAIYTLRHPPPVEKLQYAVMDITGHESQPLHPSVEQTASDVKGVVTELVDTSKRRTMRTRELVMLGGVLINFTDYSPTLQPYAETPFSHIKDLYDGVTEMALDKGQPLTFSEQIQMALEQTEGDLPESLWRLFITSRMFGRWLDAKAINNIPEFSRDEKLKMMLKWQQSLAACKTVDDGLSQDVGGDTYYVWTHVLGVVASNALSKPSQLTKWASRRFEHGTETLESYLGEKAPQMSDHRNAAEYGNAIAEVCSGILTPSQNSLITMETENSYILPTGEASRIRSRKRFSRTSEEQRRQPMESREYFGHIDRIVTEIGQFKGGYEGWWVVGSMGRAGVTEHPFDHIRDDGSLRDLDVLFSYPNLPISEWLWSNNPTPVKIGTGMGNYMRVEPRESAKLFFGPVEKEVPIESFPTVMVNVGGVVFPTLPPETLFHLQAARPKWREQDLSSMIDLAWYMKAHRDKSRYPESLYESYHEYMDMLRESGIRNSLLYKLKEWGDRYQESRLNKIFPISHPLIRKPIEEAWDLIGRAQRAGSIEDNEIVTNPQVLYEASPREEPYVVERQGIKIKFLRRTYSGALEVERDDFEHKFGDELISNLSPDDVFLDIGAAEGLYSILGAKALARKVYAVEPNTSSLWQIQKNLMINGDVRDRVVVLPIALGAANSEFRQDTIRGDSTKVKIDGKTVDGLIEKGQIETPDVVRIDASATEDLILKGMQKLLTSPGRPKHLFIEIHSFLLPKFGSSLEEVLDCVAEMGYVSVADPIVLKYESQYHFVPAKSEE